jgi:DNA-binding NtrC family response regulator
MMADRDGVLVVDDEEAVRESLASWLREDGYRVETAPDGATALRSLAERPCAVLLVDLKMPGLDGLEVLVRAQALQPDVAIVLMTAYATVETAVRAMKQGAVDYLVKPFDPEAASRLVAQCLRHARHSPGAETEADTLREAERRHIAAALGAHDWNISRTARSLEIDRVTLYSKIKRYQLRRDDA